MNYTKGDFTVASLGTDTVKVDKDLKAVDLTFSVDYAKSKESPTEIMMTNVTGTDIGAFETIRYGGTDVADIYAATTIPSATRLLNKSGRQVLVELKTTYRATNSKTGEIYDIPLVSRMVMRTSQSPLVTDAMIWDGMKRLYGSMTDTGSSGAQRLIECMRGSLLPKGV